MGYFGGDRPLIAMAPTLLHRNQPRFDRLAKWPLAVCDATPAAPASSRAVSARPSISTSSMLARPGSPISAPISASLDRLSTAATAIRMPFYKRPHGGATADAVA